MSSRPNSLARRRLDGTSAFRAASASRAEHTATQSVAAVSTPTPTVAWKVVGEPADVYDHPNGIVIAHIDENEVVEEALYHVDLFGIPWVAVISDEGIVAWLRRYLVCRLDELPKPQLVEVCSEGGAAPEHGVPAPVAIANTRFMHDLHTLPSDIEVISEFWQNRDWVPLLGAAKDERDWNSEYMGLLDALLHTPVSTAASAVSSTEEARSKLQELYADFAAMCQDAISTIVGEMFSPQAERTVKAHRLGIFFYRGAYLRICYDTSAGVYAGDANAMKVAAQQFRSYSHLLCVAPRYLLCMPLTFIMTHLGFRVVASTIPPVSATTRLSVDLLKNSSIGTIGSLVADLCRELNLKEHRQPSDGSLARLPTDAGIYWGRDGRLYLMNTGRLLPPLAPVAVTSTTAQYNLFCSPLFWRVRPELITGLDRALSCEAFTRDACTAEDNDEIISITEWMKAVNIPTTSAVFSMLEQTLAETPEFMCSATTEDVRCQFGFVVCNSPTQCCMIGPQAYVDLVKIAHWQEKPKLAQEKLATYVKCINGQARLLHGLIMVPDVSTVMHSHGVNLRYLGLVWAGIAQMSRPCTAHYLEVEMIARTAKQLLWKSLRKARDLDERRAVCINFYLALLQHDGQLAELFWANDLGPAIATQFDLTAPFDTSRIDAFLLHSRVAELTGIALTPESLSSFYTDKPFVQLQPPHPCMKNARLPSYVTTLGERHAYMAAHRDALIQCDAIFRRQLVAGLSGRADERSSGETAAVVSAWESLMPHFMRSSAAAAAGGIPW